MVDKLQKKVFKTYETVQLLHQAETIVLEQQVKSLASNWQDSETPALQRKVVEVQLDNLQKGYVDPVFSTLLAALKEVKLTSFTLLDAACASGYYSEVIKSLDEREIDYQGCDYSEAMVKMAQSYYPELEFQVQDLTQLSYPSRSIDVVLVSGVLEHIPDYQKAIAEVCRVSKQYLIIHRCPLTPKSEHMFTVGSQYNIETPRIYFSKRKLLQEVEAQRFSLAKQIDVVYGSVTPFQKLKSLVKRVMLPNKFRNQENRYNQVQTLVFSYRHDNGR